jgi:uncharacterized membrane protein YtjA (UPF0391 family)
MRHGGTPEAALGLSPQPAAISAPANSKREDLAMLKWAIISAIIAIVAGALGFAGIAGAAAGIAKFLFFAFLVLFYLFLIAAFVAGKKVSSTFHDKN